MEARHYAIPIRYNDILIYPPTGSNHTLSQFFKFIFHDFPGFPPLVGCTYICFGGKVLLPVLPFEAANGNLVTPWGVTFHGNRMALRPGPNLKKDPLRCNSSQLIKKNNEHVSLLMLLQVLGSANRQPNTEKSQSIPGWWFQIFVNFTSNLGKIPSLTNTFPRG